MTAGKQKIVIAVTGASGSLYARILLDKLQQLKDQVEETAVVYTDNAKEVWKHELGNESYKDFPFKIYDRKDFFAPFASGSARFTCMIICPCSMGMLARIANGISDDLISRAADVMLKERRKLILVTRDTPLSLVHVENFRKITLSGGIICPASPSFYSRPLTIESLAATVIDRVLDLAGLEHLSYRWQEGK